MFLKKFYVATATLLIVSGFVTPCFSRDQLKIVGSSTVFPFATAVGEELSVNYGLASPVIESTGSGGGIKLFCEGVDENTPDIVNASRQMKDKERETCAKNGVKDIVEVPIGYDGIVLANKKDSHLFTFQLKELFLALAKYVPDPKNEQKWIENPYKTWDQINATLPKQDIEVYGPPPTSGTRDAFVELALEAACHQFEAVKSLTKEDTIRYCTTMREDGAFIEAGENDNLIIQKLNLNETALGVFGYSFLSDNEDKVQASHVAGVAPTIETISKGEYPLSRSLYFYIKVQHKDQVTTLSDYVTEFTAKHAWGKEGYLKAKGLIPLPEEQRATIRQTLDAKGLIVK